MLISSPVTTIFSVRLHFNMYMLITDNAAFFDRDSPRLLQRATSYNPNEREFGKDSSTPILFMQRKDLCVVSL